MTEPPTPEVTAKVAAMGEALDELRARLELLAEEFTNFQKQLADMKPDPNKQKAPPV